MGIDILTTPTSTTLRPSDEFIGIQTLNITINSPNLEFGLGASSWNDLSLKRLEPTNQDQRPPAERFNDGLDQNSNESAVGLVFFEKLMPLQKRDLLVELFVNRA